MECYLSINRGVDRVSIEGIDRYATVDAFSTNDPSFLTTY